MSIGRRFVSILGAIAAVTITSGSCCYSFGEEVFTEDVRISTGFLPTLVLQEDNGGADPPLPNGEWNLRGTWSNFFIQDAMAVTTPFEIQAGAPDDSFFIDSEGNVGVGIDMPSERLHLWGSPADAVRIRMDTGDDVNGFETWMLEARTGSFSLMNWPDITGQRYPLTVESGAPDETLCLTANGSIGVGTSLPRQIGSTNGTGRFFNLRANGNTAATGVANGVFQGQLGAQNHFAHLGAPANQRIMRLQTSSGFTGFHALNDNLTSYAVANIISMKMSNGNVGLRVQNPAHPLHLASGAHVTAGGVWTNASSRELKDDIKPIDGNTAREVVRALQPVGYRYKNEPDERYVGFIAEDVPELVATNDRKSLAPMDVVAVLTKVVQDQDRRNEQLEATVARQQALLDSLSKRLAELEAKSK